MRPIRARTCRPSRAVPADGGCGRRRQVLEAVRSAAEELANTPAICRKSYVHPAVVTAFETGALREFAEVLKRARSNKPVEAAIGAVLLDAVAAA